MANPLSFEDALKASAADTETLLNQLLDPGRTPVRRLVEAMRYAALGPGKRIRPFLVLESSALFDVPRRQALRVAAAIECVHCYSLAHDDLPAMDDDDLRRGRPSLHRAFDEATAILAGDALLTLAFETLAAEATHADPAVRAALVSRLAGASGMAGMVAGQTLDIAAETRVNSSISEIEQIQHLKTGALFRFACEAGAVLGGADSAPLRQYADNIGRAFQIADDILDVESTSAALGKATQKDKTKGKATFVDLLGLEGARSRAKALADRAIAALAPFGGRAALLAEAARFAISRRS